MLKLTCRRWCCSLLILVVGAAAIGIATLLLYEPEERVGPTNFHRLHAGTASDAVHAILGDPDSPDSDHVEPAGVEHVTDIDWTLETWGADGTRYSAGNGAAIEIYNGIFSSWTGKVYRIDVEWGNDGRVVGAALTRRGSAPRGLWERAREWLPTNIGL